MSNGSEIARADEALRPLEWYQGLPEHQRHKANTGVIILHRLNDNKDLWDEIFSVMPMARALFGENIEEALKLIWRQVVAVKVSAEMYRTDAGHDAEFTAKMERDFWDHGNAAPNPVADNVTSAVSQLELWLLPVIRADMPRKAGLLGRLRPRE